MADLGWFRHFGQRPKTPTIPGASPEEPGSLSSPSKIMTSPTRRLHRGPAVRRVSSLLSLASSEHNTSNAAPLTAPTSASFKTIHSSDAASSKTIPADEVHVDLNSPSSTTTAVTRPKSPDLFVREADRIWHAPSLDQMIESLQVAMMNKPSTLEPLPLQYNGHVLALLEGYAKVKRELEETRRTAAEEVEEIKRLRIKELESYRLLSEDWLKRQQNYTAEIKRLELLLAHHTQEGMAAVALARAGSVVDRGARARKGFEERVKRLSRGDDDDGGVAPVHSKPETSPLGRKSSVYTHISHIPLNIDPDHDRRLSEQLKNKDKKHAHRFSRLARKYCRHPKGSEHRTDQRGTVALQKNTGTGLATDAKDTRDPDGSPAQTSKSRKQADTGLYPEFISSSSSAYLSHSSSSSSDSVRPASKVKGAAGAHETGDRDVDRNFQASQHVGGGANTAPLNYETRTMGELAIERFLKDGITVPRAIEHSGDDELACGHIDAIAEDYFTQPRRRRARGFSFIAGDDDSLPVSPMALPPPTRRSSDMSTEAARQGWSPADGQTQTIQVSAPYEIRQPRPWWTISKSAGLSTAPQLERTSATESSRTDLAPITTTPAQTMGNLFTPTAVTTTPSTLPNQPRPTSTGSVIYTGGDHPSTAAGSRDSTGSRITVLRDNSGRARARRQSSQGQDTPDPSFDSSPAMPPITEGRTFSDVSPTPLIRGGCSGARTRSGRRSRGGGVSSPTSSPALTGAERGDSPTPAPAPAPWRHPSSSSSASPASGGGSGPTPRREPSGSGGGSEAGATAAAGQAARIAAAVAHARGQKRSCQS